MGVDEGFFCEALHFSVSCLVGIVEVDAEDDGDRGDENCNDEKCS